jgi:alpha-galactosidase
MMPVDIVAGPSVEVPASDPQRFYAHGWHSWCRTGWVDPQHSRRRIRDRVDRLGHDDPIHAFDAHPGGSAVGAVEHRDGTVTLVGALGLGGWVSLERGRLAGRYEDDPGRWLVARGNPGEVFDAYARELASVHGRRGGTDVRLWSSWYGYYEDIDADRIERVIDGLGDLPFDTVQIDDGWQVAIGDWAPNARFPQGVAPLAQRIAATGRRAGLWLAPFIAAPDSAVTARHPEMLLRDENGDPVMAGENWGAPYFALDVTHPATTDHLERLFTGLVAAGFGFFKLDFVYAAAFPGRPHSPMGREAAYRNGLATIREVVGDEVYLLACGAPIAASIGMCDGIRIGPDVGPWWVDPDAADPATGRGARNALATAVNRLWLRPAIDIDPDVVYFREHGVRLNAAARHRLRQLAHIAHFRGSSDPPEWLTAEERHALGRFLAEEPAILETSRFGWRVGAEDVDFAPVLDGTVEAREITA